MGCSSSSTAAASPGVNVLRSDFVVDIFVQLLNPDNYEILHLLAEGSMAKVFSARAKETGEEVALKFFGYTAYFPDFNSVKHELELMSLAKEIDGVVHTIGYFMDTESGLVPGKRRRGCFPVFVMEKLAGGELFEWVRQRKQFTEQSVSSIFRMAVSAIEGLHRRRLLHRDLKLENIMLRDATDVFTLKIIDFGLMVYVPPYGELDMPALDVKQELESPYAAEDCHYRGLSLQGSPGLVAPESIMFFDYSCKSDIWQLGCILYSLLSATHPFSPSRVDSVLSARYFPMEGEHWEGVSDEAKGVVAWMLQKDPAMRPTAKEVLQHAWLRPTNSQTLAGETIHDMSDPDGYASRLRGLVLAQKLRSIFLSPDWVARDVERASRRDLLSHLRVKWSDDSIPCFNPPSRDEGGCVTVPVEALEDFDSTDSSEGLDEQGHLSIEERLGLLQSKCMTHTKKNSSVVAEDVAYEVDFTAFVELLVQCGLQRMATKNVFNIFNYKRTAKINIHDFIESMQAVFHHHRNPRVLLHLGTFPIEEDVDPDDEEVLNIFRMLDVKHRGFITISEMKVGIRCIMLAEFLKSHRKSFSADYRGALLQQQISSRSTLTHSTVASAPMSVKSTDVEGLFKRLDPLRSGKIDFEAFKEFYRDIVTPAPSPAHFMPDHNQVILEESEGFGSVCDL